MTSHNWATRAVLFSALKMSNSRCIQSLILCSLWFTSALGQMCVYQVCFCDRQVIFCYELGLKEIPAMTGEDDPYLTDLNFDGNQITTIPSGSLPRGLIYISFIDNPIKTIADDAFSGSEDILTSLDFSLANDTRIPDALIHLKSLTSFGIYDSGTVTDWNIDVMKHLGPNLQSFTLKNVSLSEWPDYIQFFGNLTELTVKYTSLSSVPDNSFDLIASSLTQLDLSNNKLRAVPKALSKLTALEMLYLDHNKISDTRWLPVSNKLISISLDSNDIFNASQLSQSLRAYKDSLNVVSLQINRLTSIPDLDFLNIGTIDLSNNRIADVISGSLSPDLSQLNLGNNFLPSLPAVMKNMNSLTSIMLPWNVISVIQGSQFPPSTQLIEMGYNILTELTETSFPQSSKIQTLRLSYNPIFRISNMAFSNLPNLMELNLSSSKLTRLPLGLASLQHLYILDMDGVLGLVCTCQEKNLAPLITSMQTDYVIGYCGMTSIYDFFKTLSPNCP
ncbi:hypothetical protein BsWGS_08867 [Bradybaena similaris]